MFEKHGTVNSCIIMRDDEGKSKVGDKQCGSNHIQPSCL